MTLAAAAVVGIGLLAACGSAAPTKKNFLYIMADDLDFDYKQDRLALMPNLRTRIRETGVHMVNHVAVQSVCGPSRSSLLAGRFPHNVGYLANNDPPSVAAWRKQQNNTIGTWMTQAGYHTAFLGKYVNGLEDTVPSGWHHWGGFSSTVGTYNYYNASQWNVTFSEDGKTPITPIRSVLHTGVHQADFLGQQAVEQASIAVAKGKPFYISVTPVMVHFGVCYNHPPGGWADEDPYWETHLEKFGCTDPARNSNCIMPISPCPTKRNAHKFDGLVNPHVPSWNVSVAGDLSKWESQQQPLTAYEEERQNMGFRNRTSAAVDLDEMIGVVLDGLQSLGVLEDTYVIFTSDNGYHLGEHRFVYGKTEPFDTDTRLPLYITGPGIPANSTLPHPTNHIDITATVVEIAGASPVGPPLDGLSFRSAFGPNPAPFTQWRNYSYSEFFGNFNTWVRLRWPANPADPENSDLGYQYWCTNTAEVFDHAADPWELTNLAGTGGIPRGNAAAARLLPLALALHSCSGSSCHAPEPALLPLHTAAAVLPCANVTSMDAFDP